MVEYPQRTRIHKSRDLPEMEKSDYALYGIYQPMSSSSNCLFVAMSLSNPPNKLLPIIPSFSKSRMYDNQFKCKMSLVCMLIGWPVDIQIIRLQQFKPILF